MAVPRHDSPNPQRSAWGKMAINIIAEILVFLQQKRLTSMPRCPLFRHLASQLDPKPFKRVIAFWFSSAKKE